MNEPEDRGQSIEPTTFDPEKYPYRFIGVPSMIHAKNALLKIVKI